MKIGIIGAPGAGKSRFAKKLAYQLHKDPDAKFRVVDGYVEDLEAHTDFAYGYFATYAQNFQIVMARWTQEQEYGRRSDTITCGTIYETLIYCGISANRSYVNDQEDFIQGRQTMQAMAMLETLTADYDALFFLPLSEKIREEKGRSYDIVIDSKIPEVLEGSFKSAIELRGTEKENVKYATELITSIKRQKTAEDEQQAVRGSGEASLEKPSEG